MTAKTSSIAVVRAYPNISGINTGVGIAVRKGIKDLLSIYSGGIYK